MKKILENIWTKRIVSVFSILFGIFVGVLSYMSVFYSLMISDTTKFGIVIILTCICFAVLMLFSRKQFITTVVSLIALPLFLPALILYFGEWLLIVPVAAVILIMFFMCGANEGTKTIFGTVCLMFYILVALVYFLYTTVFSTQAEDTVRQTVISDSGLYRCYVLDVSDSSTGGTKIYVEPNTYDKNYGFVSFIAKGYKHIVYSDRNHYQIKLEWDTEKKENLNTKLPVCLELGIDDLRELTESNTLDFTEEQLDILETLMKDGTVYYNGEGEIQFDIDFEDAGIVDISYLGLTKDVKTKVYTEDEEIITKEYYCPLELDEYDRSLCGFAESGDLTVDRDFMFQLVWFGITKWTAEERTTIADQIEAGTGSATYIEETQEIIFDNIELSDEMKESIGVVVRENVETVTREYTETEETVIKSVSISNDKLSEFGLTDSGDVLYITAYDDEGNIVDNANGDTLDRMLYFRYDEAVMKRWFAKDNREFEIG